MYLIFCKNNNIQPTNQGQVESSEQSQSFYKTIDTDLKKSDELTRQRKGGIVWNFDKLQ